MTDTAPRPASSSEPEQLAGSIYSRSFGAEASRYDQARPSYPAAAVEEVLGGPDTARGQRILDLGAGTGKLTRSLLGRGAEVTAVEPDPQMLAVLSTELPGVRALAGWAQQIPLPDRSVDAILVGQAFHWFPRPEADREMARVLRPGGVVGLIWNFPDRSVEWVSKLYQATKERQLPWSAEFGQLDAQLFGNAQESSFRSAHSLAGPDGLRDLVHTWSWVITRSEQEREAIDQRLRVLISQYAELQAPVVTLPQRTKVIRQSRR
jgi:ubiquinone/menaquinone biosynthesis C-methylase UbiE